MIQENIPIYEQIIEKAVKLTSLSSTESLNTVYSEMSIEEKTQDILTPKVLAHREANVPTIFIRFNEDQSLLTEAIYYPYLAIDSFWMMLEAYYDNSPLTKEQIKEQIITDCVYMTATLINSIYERMMISMSWIPNEIIDQWLKKVRDANVQQGLPASKKEINIINHWC